MKNKRFLNLVFASLARKCSPDGRPLLPAKPANKSKRYVFAVTNYQVCLWPLCMLTEMLLYHFHNLVGQNYRGIKLGLWQNRVNKWAINPEVYDCLPQILLEKVIRNSRWAWMIAKEIPKVSQELVDYSQRIYNSDLAKKSRKELLKFYLDYRKRFLNMYLPGWLPNSLEGLSGLFTKELEARLLGKLKIVKKENRLGDFFSVLTTPSRLTNRQKEELELLKIILEVYSKPDLRARFLRNELKSAEHYLKEKYPRLHRRVETHQERNSWIPFDYEGPGWTLRDFLRMICEALRNLKRTKKRLGELNSYTREQQVLFKRIIKKSGLQNDKKLYNLFRLAKELMYLKDLRKDALFKSYFYIDKLIREIGRRLNLTSVQVKHILPQEMAGALIRNRHDLQKLNQRIKYSVLVYGKRKISIFTGGEAKKIVKKLVAENHHRANTREIKGECAYPGIVKGYVKLINEAKDLKKIRKGDILVSVATSPNLLPAMKIAAAFVTDKGGITSHAAIIARELKTPCVTGTKQATKILKDRDFVEVNANVGVVKKL